MNNQQFNTAQEVFEDVQISHGVAIANFLLNPCQASELALKRSSHALAQSAKFALNNASKDNPEPPAGDPDVDANDA